MASLKTVILHYFLAGQVQTSFQLRHGLHVLGSDTQGIKRVLNIAGIAVFVVGKFSQEHFINEIVSSFISGNGRLKLIAVPGKHFM